MDIYFNSFDDIKKPKREFKGKSIIDFPENYCIIDIETTGLSPDFDDIIEIAAIKFDKAKEIDSFQSLVQPPCFADGEYISDFISDLTGITNEMLEKAPSTHIALTNFLNFINKDDILVGHNVNFDINFLYDNFLNYLEQKFSNNFIDTMRIARKLHPELPHHRLKDIKKLYDIDSVCEHRALSDCYSTNSIYVELYKTMLNKYNNKTAFIELFKRKRKRKPNNTLKAKNIISDGSVEDPSNPIYKKYCCFTGKLEQFTRREAMQIVANIGGFNEDTVTRKTNFLVIGNFNYCKSIKDGKSSKQKKAEKNKLAGQDIEILTESVFYDMLDDFIY